MSTRPLPIPTEDTKPYWEGAKASKLLIQKCAMCDTLQFYPRTYCLTCLNESMTWVEAAGDGEIYTFSINHRPANEYMKDKIPYAVAAIDLDEGVRMLANIVESDIRQIKCGARVKVVFEKASDEITLPQFKLVG
jgi:hypothetical protein